MVPLRPALDPYCWRLIREGCTTPKVAPRPHPLSVLVDTSGLLRYTRNACCDDNRRLEPLLQIFV